MAASGWQPAYMHDAAAAPTEAVSHCTCSICSWPADYSDLYARSSRGLQQQHQTWLCCQSEAEQGAYAPGHVSCMASFYDLEACVTDSADYLLPKSRKYNTCSEHMAQGNRAQGHKA